MDYLIMGGAVCVIIALIVWYIKYFNKKNLENIKKFVEKHSSDCKKIFFPADINLDKVLFTNIRKIIPDLEIYDRTKHNLQDTINLFSTCI